MPRPYVVWSGSTGVQYFQPFCSGRGLPVWKVPFGVQHAPTLLGASQGEAHCVSAPLQQVRRQVPAGSSGLLYPLPVETVKLSLPGSPSGGVPFQVRLTLSGGVRFTATVLMYGSLAR